MGLMSEREREREREREGERGDERETCAAAALFKSGRPPPRSVTAAAPLIVNVKPEPRKIGHSLFQDRLEFLVSYKWQHIAVL